MHFCTAPDGARIAYAVAGQGPAAGEGGQLAQSPRIRLAKPDLESPAACARGRASADPLRRARQRAVRLGRRRHLVRCLRAAISRAWSKPPACERFALLGISQGCAVSVAYAVRHPGARRATSCSMAALRAAAQARLATMAQPDTLIALIRQGWGQENPAFRQFFTSLFHARRHGRADAVVQRPAAHHHVARERSAHPGTRWIDIDVTDLLPQREVPTLVLHCRQRRARSRSMKAAGSRPAFPARASWRSKAAIISSWKASRAGQRFFEEISGFLVMTAREEPRCLRPRTRAPRTLFTEILCCTFANIWQNNRRCSTASTWNPCSSPPSSRRVMKVEPAWIDYNGHLNMAYYNVLFDRAVDEVFELLGCGADYVKKGILHLHRRGARALPARVEGRRPGAGHLPAARLRCQSGCIISSSSSTPRKAGCRPPRRTCRCMSTWRRRRPRRSRPR